MIGTLIKSSLPTATAFLGSVFVFEGGFYLELLQALIIAIIVKMIIYLNDERIKRLSRKAKICIYKKTKK